MRYVVFTLSLCIQLLSFQIPVAFTQQSVNGSWNQFRGPGRNGAYPGFELPGAWPEDGPELIWKKAIGSSFSEITVAGDRIYTMLSEQTDTASGWEYVAAFDAATGEEVWRTRVDSLFFDEFGNGTRATPSIHDDLIYCFSCYGKLSAHRIADGQTVWQTDLVAEFGSPQPRWAFSASPVVVADVVIIEAGGTDSRGFIGFDRWTGEVRWTKGNGLAGYSSPVVAEMDGKTQIIFASQTTLYAFNAAGDTLWTHAMSLNGPMASPVVLDGNRIFISTVRSEGFSIVEVNNNRPKEILREGTMKNDFSSSVYHNGYIYGFDVAALQCISATTGAKQWVKRGFGKGSLILVGENLLVLSDQGKLIRVKATHEAYEELGSFQALQGKSWTAPSFADGKLYVRNLAEMACYKIK
jgi:outer membrane protein assembly factor BamB